MQLGQGVELIQQQKRPYKDGQPEIPIFLIHDGGGTTFAYHCLDVLNRFVYGISNPYFYNPEGFEGGLADLGELYTALIRKAVTAKGFPTRRAIDGRIQIYLGGWSLGGMLSLEIASRLIDDEDIQVAAIVMADTVYPGTFKGYKPGSTEHVFEEGLTRSQMLSRRCMAQASRMVCDWDMPVWDGDDEGLRPKIILLRAKQPVPPEANAFRIPGLDEHRIDKRLGWDDYDKDTFTYVFPVEGHHFDMFGLTRIEETTKVLKRALEKLDNESASEGWLPW